MVFSHNNVCLLGISGEYEGRIAATLYMGVQKGFYIVFRVVGDGLKLIDDNDTWSVGKDKASK